MGLDPRVRIVVIILWFYAFVFYGATFDIVHTMFGYFYPMFASFRAVVEADHDDISKWLKYWVTFACLSLTGNVLAPVFRLNRYHHLVSLAFTFWLFLPRIQGAQPLYSWVIAPVLRLSQPRIAKVVAESTAGLVPGNVYGQLADGEAYLKDRFAKEITKAAVAQIGKTCYKEAE